MERWDCAPLLDCDLIMTVALAVLVYDHHPRHIISGDVPWG